jgi:hypothetical protein
MATLKNTVIDDTAALQLPVGTTAQRPVDGTGMFRFNSSFKNVEYSDGNTWRYLPDIIRTSLIFYIDAGEPTSYSGSGSFWNDMSINAISGTYNGSYNSSFGGYFVFNNNTSSDINFSGYSSNITCEAFFRTTDGIDWSNIICGGCGDIIFTIQNSRVNFGNQCNSPIPHANYSTTIVNTGNWFHAAATYDGNNVRIYVNGVLENIVNRSGIITPTIKRIGSNNTGTSEFFKGDLATLRVYNKTLSPQEIQQNYNATKARFGI